LYESSFLGHSNVNNSQKLLKRFAYFSLLKKEVSCHFIAIALNESEIEIKEFVSTFSKWFNSAQVGKYTIYHERLRVYILSKLSQNEFVAYNNRMIELAQDALAKSSHDEIEHYALEFLSSHLFIDSMITGNGEALRKIAYDNSYWNRQIEISKGFDWSKNMLNEMMLWASKYNEEDVIECGLNKVDLYHKEQNDAPRIIELVSQNDIETALQRIEAFGGNDKEGLQRKFILYMLCLMELTLLNGRDKTFRKEAIEKLLKHFDENLPVDHSVLDWNNFFPSYLVFRMVCECAELGLDYLIVYKRSDGWEMDWINVIEFINPIQFEVLLNSSRGISNQWYKCNALKVITNILYEYGQLEEFASVLRELLAFGRSLSDDSDNSDKGNVLKEVAIIRTRQSQLNDALNIVDEIIDETIKDEAYLDIAFEISKQGDKDGSISIIQKIVDESEKISALKRIAVELCKQGKIEESLKIVRGINNEFLKCSALMKISIELSKMGDNEKTASIMSESLEIAQGTGGREPYDIFLAEFAIERSRQSQFEEALQISGSIHDDREKSLALFAIAEELSKQGNKEESSVIFQESLDIIKGIVNISEKDRGLEEIAIELSKQCRTMESLDIVDAISDERCKNSTLKEIAVELVKQGKLKESLEIARRTSDKSSKMNTIKDILIELSKMNQFIELASVMYESLISSRGTSDNIQRCEILKDIASDLIKNGHLDKSLGIAGSISVEQVRFDALENIAIELFKQSKLHDALAIISSIGDDLVESNYLTKISIELSKEGKLNESLVIAQKINDSQGKISSLSSISVELFKQGCFEVSGSLIQESLVIAKEIADDWGMSLALTQIAVKLSEQGKFEESLNVVNEITDDYWEPWAFHYIAVELAKQGRIQESIDVIGRIGNESDEFAALSDISIELCKQGLLQESLNIAKNINYEHAEIRAMKGIALELSLKNNWILSEEIVMDISIKSEQVACWLDIGRNNNIMRGYTDSIKQISQFKSIEASHYYRMGVIKQINSVTINQEILLDVLRDQRNDIISLKYLLEIYAIKQIIVPKLSEQQCQRLSKSFDLNWVTDIKNHLSTSNLNFT
jgi:tetratricopeptide (TPR) repeat protein